MHRDNIDLKKIGALKNQLILVVCPGKNYVGSVSIAHQQWTSVLHVYAQNSNVCNHYLHITSVKIQF